MICVFLLQRNKLLYRIDLNKDVVFSLISGRFVTETVLSCVSIICNTLALVAVRYVHGHQTAYHILFTNLSIANILCSVLSWLCNNTLFLFENQITFMIISGTHSVCELFVYLMAAVLVSTSFGIVSTLTMLGFATVHYFAICNPLHHETIVRKRRIWIFICCTWIVTLGSACIPFVTMLNIVKRGECGEDMLSHILFMVVLTTNVSIGVVALVYVTIVSLCLRIYAEIYKLQKRLSQFRFNQEVNSERKAFITIVILIATLTIFFIPFAVVYVVSLNSNSGSHLQSDALIYYMNLLPYIKYFTDPIIYGARMREIRDTWRHVLVRCGLVKCTCLQSAEFIQVPTSSGSVTITVAVSAV